MKSSQSVGLRMVKKPDLVSVPRQRECCGWTKGGTHACRHAHAHSHTLSLVPTHTHTPTLVCAHTLSRTLSLLHLDTVTLSCMHTHFHTHTHSLLCLHTLSLLCLHTLSLLCLHTLSLLCAHNTHFLSYSDSLSLSLSHTHTHTHTNKTHTNKQRKTAFFTALSVTVKIKATLSESRHVLVQNGWDSSVGRVTDQKASIIVMLVQFPGAARDSPHPPPITFIADSCGVTQLLRAIACIDTCALVKVPKLVAKSVFGHAKMLHLQLLCKTQRSLWLHCRRFDLTMIGTRLKRPGVFTTVRPTLTGRKDCGGDSKDIV